MGTKGIVLRFIASRVKISVTSPVSSTSPVSIQLDYYCTTPITNPITLAKAIVIPEAITPTPEGKPVNKGYVPLEENIQRELRKMKEREHELKKMRKKRKPFDIDFSDNETSSELDEEDVPLQFKLKAIKSPEQEFFVLSTALLITLWKSIIQQNQKTGAA